MTALFVWTVDGVMKVIALGVMLLAALVLVVLVLIVKVAEWLDRRNKR